MSVMKYKDPVTKQWLPVPVLKVMTEYAGGSGVGSVVGVPSDIVAEAERVASSIKTKMSANSVNFIAMSDMHEMGDSDHSDATIVERYRRANLNAGQGARLVAEKINPDFFANLGDLAWGGSSTNLHDLAQSVVKARGYTAPLETITECFYTPGNHDVDYSGGYLDENIATGMIGGYRYVDLTAKKVRVICLNTADNTDGTDSDKRISGEQLQWFANALDLSGKSDAASWGIIVLSHHPIDWDLDTSNIIPAANCVAAYMNGTKYSVTHDGMTITKDFTGKNMATFIANIHGHTHCFKVGNISGSEALRVAIPNACFGRTNEYGEGGNTEFGETASYEKTDNGTGKNTAFCAVSIDLDKKVIYADCFGAGYDRVISYGGDVIVTCSVINNLNNATTSNGANVVTEGASYSATITANDGYELATITVTMGGVDITASAVNGNSITIANVTGNIVITATTAQVEVKPVYTNLVPASVTTDGVTVFNRTGYKNGTYASLAHYDVDANCVTTGFIWLSSNVNAIYVKGATWDTTNGHCRINLFADGNLGNANMMSNQIKANVSQNWIGVETLGTNYYKFTVKDAGIKNHWYCMSLVGTGENLIITHDEPID